MICNSDCAEDWITLSERRCSGSSRVWARISTMPVTPIIGVRISWLIAARNALLATLASRARLSLARRSASSCLIRVRSAATASRPLPPRRSSGNGASASSACTAWPSRCSIGTSTGATPVSASARSRRQSAGISAPARSFSSAAIAAKLAGSINGGAKSPTRSGIGASRPMKSSGR